MSLTEREIVRARCKELGIVINERELFNINLKGQGEQYIPKYNPAISKDFPILKINFNYEP